MNHRRPRSLAALAFLACLAIATTTHATPAPCIGDCDKSNDVTVDELVTMVFIALGGAAVTSCTAGDADGGGSITVDEVITASTKALDGCSTTPTATIAPSTTPTAAETATLTVTPTDDGTAAPEETGTPEPTGSEATEPIETETPAPTTTNGMMPITQSPKPTESLPSQTPHATATLPPPVPSATPPPIPTATAVIIPTNSPEPLPTHTSAASGAHLDVGSASGAPGSMVSITVVLSGGNGILTATSNDIVYDKRRVRAVQNGGPVCTINPAIGSGSAVNKMLLTSVVPTTATFERLRIGVIGFSNAFAIPDGLLTTCRFEIAADAPPGAIVLQNIPTASNLSGDAIPVVGSHGTITVQ